MPRDVMNTTLLGAYASSKPDHSHHHRQRRPVLQLLLLFEFEERARPVHLPDEFPVGIRSDRVHRAAVQNHAERPLIQPQQRVARLQTALKPRALDLRLTSPRQSHHLHRALIEFAQLLHEKRQAQRVQRVRAPRENPVHHERLLQPEALQLRERQRLRGESGDLRGLGGEKAVVGEREILVALHGLADVGGNAALQLGLLRFLERRAVG